MVVRTLAFWLFGSLVGRGGTSIGLGPSSLSGSDVGRLRLFGSQVVCDSASSGLGRQHTNVLTVVSAILSFDTIRMFLDLINILAVGRWATIL